MDLKMLEQQRKTLRAEIVDRLFSLHSPDMAPLRRMDPDDPGRALYTELERQLEEKKAQLRALDARIEHASAPRSRFREECFRMRGILWLAVVCMCLTALSSALFIGGGFAVLTGLLTPVVLIWAVWASSPPSH